MRYLILIISFTLSSLKLSAQNASFSQVQFAPFTINPALAGLHNDLKFNTIFRASQMGNQGLLFRGQVSCDVAVNGKRKFKTGRFGIGVNYNYESGSAAQLMNNQIQLNIAYNWIIRKWHTIGFGGYFGYGLNRHAPIFMTNNNGWAQSGDGQINNGIDVGAGFLYTYKKGKTHMVSNNQQALDVGVSVYHILSPDYYFLQDLSNSYNMRYSFFVRGHQGVARNMTLSPALYYQFISLSRHDFLMGTYLKFRLNYGSRYTGYSKSSSISFGAFYRWTDAFIFNVLYQRGNVHIGGSFDIGVTSFGVDTGLRFGAEAVFRYTIPSFYMRPIGGRTGRSY